MGLKEYHRKRDFKKTAEPKGSVEKDAGKELIFVIQKHDASRLHYDFRIEWKGVLLSWAVPKGPSLDTKERRLAVHVEDHPIDYATFEGIIPEGQYGGGTVMLWDRGTWEPQGYPDKELKAGNLKMILHGEKLKGGFALVQMHGKSGGEDGKNWLLIKEKDDHVSSTDVLKKKPKSVSTGRTLEEIAADSDAVWKSNKAEKKTPALDVEDIPKAKKKKMPTEFSPQLATPAQSAPEGEEWLHEIKYDGYRLLAFCDAGKVKLITRGGKDWTKKFAGVHQSLVKLDLQQTILDGEVVALKKSGAADFQTLQNALKHRNDAKLVYYAFDVPWFDGSDLTAAPLIERKKLLAAVLKGDTGAVRYSGHIAGDGQSVFENACRMELEGIISKRADSIYVQKRSKSWLKVKCFKRQEFVVGGYTDPKSSRVGFGALLLGYREKKELKYCGRVGTGFDHAMLKELTVKLKKIARKTSPFSAPLTGADAKGVHYVEPTLVAEVEFAEWTGDGILRHPSFQGLREDKSAKDVGKEKPVPIEKIQNPTQTKDEFEGVRLTHPEKVLYKTQGITKGDLASYYAKVADWILPYAANRPLSIVRCPQGRGQKCFFQKHINETTPDHLYGVTIEEKSGKQEYITIKDVAGLVSLVQMGTLEIHAWGCRNDKIEKPDWMIFDLDPDERLTWKDVVAGARVVKEMLDSVELASFLKTSGGKGLHVCVPLQRRAEWDDVKSFAESVAQRCAREQPKKFVATMSKAKRAGKIFIDYLRNGRGSTCVIPYSTRAREGCPISTPIAWEELDSLKSAAEYNYSNIMDRLNNLKSDPWKDFWKTSQNVTAAKIKAMAE